MNVSGKSLQDIFNAGAKKLEELEVSERELLNKTTEEHVEEHFRQEPDSLNRLEESSKQLEEEVRGFLTRALDRINRVIKTEVDENDRYIHQLVDGLVLMAKKYGEEVEQLKQSSQQDLSHLSMDAEELYRRHCDWINSELQKRGASANEEINNNGNRSLVKVSAEAEHSLKVLRQEESTAFAKLYGSFESCSKSVDGDFERSREKEAAGFDTGCRRMKERSETALRSLKDFVESLLQEIDNHSLTSRSGLSENHGKQVGEGCAAVEQSAARVSGDLVSLLEASVLDLTMKSQELSRDMDSLSQDVKQTIENKDREYRRKDDSTSAAFTADLSDKLTAAKSFQQEMEQERSAMVGEIWKELNEVQKKFQEKLSNLAATTLEQLQSVCTEAQEAIIAAQDSCATEFRNAAGDRQRAIEGATSEFLARVQSRREAALSGISRAAGTAVSESASNEALAHLTESIEAESNVRAGDSGSSGGNGGGKKGKKHKKNNGHHAGSSRSTSDDEPAREDDDKDAVDRSEDVESSSDSEYEGDA